MLEAAKSLSDTGGLTITTLESRGPMRRPPSCSHISTTAADKDIDQDVSIEGPPPGENHGFLISRRPAARTAVGEECDITLP